MIDDRQVTPSSRRDDQVIFNRHSSEFGWRSYLGALYGTAAAIEATIEEFIDAGCGGFMVFCNSAPGLQGLEQLASLAPVRRALSGGVTVSVRTVGG